MDQSQALKLDLITKTLFDVYLLLVFVFCMYSDFLFITIISIFLLQFFLFSRHKTAHFIIYFDYLEIPAHAETYDAFVLSTTPGSYGMFAPGRRPAPLFY